MPLWSCHFTTILLFPMVLAGTSRASTVWEGEKESTQEYPNAFPGVKLRIAKVLDPESGIVKFISKSPSIKKADDLVDLERQELKAVRGKHGTLYGNLRNLENIKDSLLDVVVYLDYPPFDFLDFNQHSLSDLKAHSQGLERMRPRVSIEAMSKRYGLEVKEREDMGIFKCMVDHKRLRAMQFDPDIASISLPTIFSLTATLESLTSSAYNPASLMPVNARGQGVNAATIESGLGNSSQYQDYGNFVACLGTLILRT